MKIEIINHNQEKYIKPYSIFWIPSNNNFYKCMSDTYFQYILNEEDFMDDYEYILVVNRFEYFEFKKINYFT